MSELMTCEVWRFHELKGLADRLEQTTEPLEPHMVQALGKLLNRELDEFGVYTPYGEDSL
jgi:hypothetical protein